MIAEPSPNACRYVGQRGHVESYFLRLNDPARPRALWLKATVLAPLEGPAVAESWLVYFDGERNTTFAARRTVPVARASFAARPDGGVEIRTDALALSLADAGHARGELDGARFDLAFARAPGPLGAPLSFYPLRLLRQGPLPRFKLATPSPWLVFSGALRVAGEDLAVDGWHGMQGHNWGNEHAVEYAWGQCLFPEAGGAPPTLVEGATGRIRVAGRVTPRLSLLVVRRGATELRFDRIVDLWRQAPTLTRERWTLRMRGAAGEVRLRMDARARPVACLGYGNPDGRVSYCFNTKLADVLLEVRPRTGPAFTCRSPHGGALEFLRPEPDPEVAVV